MNDQLRVRRQKMDEMRENGIEPFGQRKFDRQDLASTLEEKYGKEDKEELNADMPKTKIAAPMISIIYTFFIAYLSICLLTIFIAKRIKK